MCARTQLRLSPPPPFIRTPHAIFLPHGSALQEKTAEVLEADGWLHSGDIGLWDAHGNLRVVDRKKNIFKLAQGEYVAAEKVENVYLRSPLVAQVYVHGDSLHSVLLAVVVPSEEGARAWAKANGKPSGALVDLCKDDAFSKAVLDDITRVGRESKLQGFEIVKAVHLEDTPFTPENVLTPSFKLKRVDAKKKYLAKVRGEAADSFRDRSSSLS